MKLISIITINYNDSCGLNNTINSVALHKDKDKDIEYVVVDGGSSDNSVSVIESNFNDIDKYISEPDTGIANAFNKGINLASGHYLLFLNAGDTLCKSAIDAIKKAIRSDNNHSLMYVGKVGLLYENSTVIAGFKISKYRQMLRNYLPHQAMVIKSSCFKEFGLYDEAYRLGMDYEWSLRLINRWDRLTFIDDVLALMDTNGVSMANYQETFRTYHQARMKNRVIPPTISYAFTLFFTLKRALGLKIKSILQ